MIIDNFDKFPWNFKQWEFYYVQVILRGKDHPDKIGVNGTNSARAVRSYSIYNDDMLVKYRRNIIEVAEAYGARAYIHPARRDRKKIVMEMIAMCTDHLLHDKHTPNAIYDSACGHNKWVERIWVVDVDDKDEVKLQAMIDEINAIKPTNTVQYTLPTKSGFHIITKPFDIRDFKHEGIDIHKNNPTLLYFNTGESNDQ